MQLPSFVPEPDAQEVHRIGIAAAPEAVYEALWSVDFGGLPVVRGLMALRALPARILRPGSCAPGRRRATLHTLLEMGFGKLAEQPGREVVLGLTGRFWRPTGNVLPFRAEDFAGPVPPGLARAAWNFAVEEQRPGHTVLSTETRVVCGDAASRRRFRAYWLVVRPFSGLIRRAMLRAVKRACERRSGTQEHTPA